MEFWGVILAVIVFLLVFCYEDILMELIAWAWHKWQDRKDRKGEESH